MTRSPRALLALAALLAACSSDDAAGPGDAGGQAGATSAGGSSTGGAAGLSGSSGQSGQPTSAGGAAGVSAAGASAGGASAGGASAGGASAGGVSAGGASAGGANAGGANAGGAGGASAGGAGDVVSKGGTMTFRQIGAPGYWGRRIEAEPGDAKCDVQGEYVNVFGTEEYCCRTKHVVDKVPLAPFNEEMTLVLRGPLRIDRMVVYQPGVGAGAPWGVRSQWAAGGSSPPTDLRFLGPGESKDWTGDLGDGCHWYATRAEPFACGPGSDPYCPAGGPDLHYRGWAGSKLLILRATMPDASQPGQAAASCQQGGVSDSPWVGWSASELMRDGAGKYHPCHCYANTNPGVGDGCGEINVWETVSEQEVGYGNRRIMSTGLRSFQVGSLGGSVCGAPGCPDSAFGEDVDLVDACQQSALTQGAELTPGGDNGCPVWRRPRGERYFIALLDEATSTVKIALVHPGNVPAALAPLLPALPAVVDRSTIDALVGLSLPQ